VQEMFPMVQIIRMVSEREKWEWVRLPDLVRWHQVGRGPQLGTSLHRAVCWAVAVPWGGVALQTIEQHSCTSHGGV